MDQGREQPVEADEDQTVCSLQSGAGRGRPLQDDELPPQLEDLSASRRACEVRNHANKAMKNLRISAILPEACPITRPETVGIRFSVGTAALRGGGLFLGENRANRVLAERVEPGKSLPLVAYAGLEAAGRLISRPLLHLLPLGASLNGSVIRHIRTLTWTADDSTPGDCFSTPAQ